MCSKKYTDELSCSQRQDVTDGSYLSISCESDSVVGTTSHLRHSLAEEVGWDQGWCQSMVGGPIAQLAVTVVAPSIHFSIYRVQRAN